MRRKITLLLLSFVALTTVNAQTLTVTSVGTAPTCANGTNGSAIITATGCAGPFTYTVNGGAPQTAPTSPFTISGLAANTYTVVVTTAGSGGPTIFQEDFETTNKFTMNTAIGTQGSAANKWVVNATTAYDGSCDAGAGNKSMHITCNGLCGFINNPALYNASDATNVTDKYCETTTSISTVGRTNLQVKFAYQCQGDTDFGADYGTFRYSVNGGTNWVDMPTIYSNAPNWTCATVSLPLACENIATLKLGFRWRNDDDGIGTDPPFNIDNVVLTGSGGGSGGCSGTSAFNLSNPAPFVVTTDAPQNPTICTGDQLTINATNATPACSLVVTQPGTYTLNCTNQAGCSGSSAAIVVGLGNPPTGGFTYNQVSNYNVNFSATTQNANSYAWLFPSGATSTLQNPSFNFPSEGNYNVSLIVTNGCGSDTVTLPVFVIKTGLNETSVISSFNLFPNPASNQFMLQLGSVKPVQGTIRVVSPMGQLVSEEVVKFNSTYSKSFDISNLSSGVYSIVITTEGKTIARKLIVE